MVDINEVKHHVPPPLYQGWVSLMGGGALPTMAAQRAPTVAFRHILLDCRHCQTVGTVGALSAIVGTVG